MQPPFSNLIDPKHPVQPVHNHHLRLVKARSVDPLAVLTSHTETRLQPVDLLLLQLNLRLPLPPLLSKLGLLPDRLGPVLVLVGQLPLEPRLLLDDAPELRLGAGGEGRVARDDCEEHLLLVLLVGPGELVVSVADLAEVPAQGVVGPLELLAVVVDGGEVAAELGEFPLEGLDVVLCLRHGCSGCPLVVHVRGWLDGWML